MEWNEKLQIIIDYVENHLQRKQEPIDPQEIAEIAGCSYNFFQKVFSYLNGISFSEYVRARKLTLAGYDLKSTDMRVVDVSYQYGYDSPTSFTKAFQQFHGITPKDARNQDVRLRAVPKMQSSVKQQYMWRLEQKASFRLIGKSIRISPWNGNHYTKIPAFWSECQRDGTFSQLTSMDKGDSKGLFGLFCCDKKSLNEAEYSIMVISDKELPEGYTEIRISEAAWAVFDCVGPVPQAIQNGWNYLQEEWLVRYPFQHAKCPELEWYSDGNAYAADYLSQIWIPVVDSKQ
ncbi:AraC family transcriptional regulator [Lacrimispora sp. NSJ-141]|uniref:AraC family transcriptional regulator n=1 Tax=Lientehia hominis TaxID=2897778 RepID=A0AAP2W9A5_9FIRM|nr:AraC family transcriptional regulator [Lientehia hominis]MCD2491514.1 AraC family transcriptional regulator [Lientehia hominis]